MSRLSLASVSAAVVFAWAVPASAHIEMISPPGRYSADFIKDAPCGMVGNPPGVNPPTVLQAGEMITIQLDEFVDHGGHFRISFSEDGTDQFVSPTAFDDFYNDPSVLMDNIPDNQDGGIHEIDFVVPDVNCDPCTLQVLQIMSGGTFSEDSLYYNCADIVIQGASAGTDGGSTDGGSATSATATATATVTDSAGDTSSDGGEADAGTTASVDDNGDDAPGETGDSAGTSGNSVTATDATADVDDEEDEGGCACSSGARPNVVWALPLFLIALARRRR